MLTRASLQGQLDTLDKRIERRTARLEKNEARLREIREKQAQRLNTLAELIRTEQADLEKDIRSRDWLRSSPVADEQNDDSDTSADGFAEAKQDAPGWQPPQ